MSTLTAADVFLHASAVEDLTIARAIHATMRRAFRALVIVILASGAFGIAPAFASAANQADPQELTLARRLYDAALTAPAAAKRDGSLYGMQRWHPATKKSYIGLSFPGLLSCAYTVSAIFKEAGHPIGQVATVQGIDAALSHWPKIIDSQRLMPGDVVFWKPRQGKIFGLSCPVGHWHVGISLGGDSTVDNDWWSGLPTQNSLERACATFAYARRAPNGMLP
jgi:hypothetical protein